MAKHLSIFPFSCVLGDAQEFETVHFPVTDNINWAVWDSMEYTIQVQDNSCHDSKSLLELHVRKQAINFHSQLAGNCNSFKSDLWLWSANGMER